jgi:hypothetical protein
MQVRRLTPLLRHVRKHDLGFLGIGDFCPRLGFLSRRLARLLWYVPACRIARFSSRAENVFGQADG